MSRGLVLVSAASVARAVPYVAALAAAGVALEAIRVVTADADEGAAGAGVAPEAIRAFTTEPTEALAGNGVAPESIRTVAEDPNETPPGTAPVAAVATAPAAGDAVGDAVHIANIAELAAGAVGLVLCGGEDVDPRRYGEVPLPAANVEVAPRRDALEWELLTAARAGRVPVWGICRGFQVLNVFFGGSLWQDLPLQRPEAAEFRKTPETPKKVAHDPGPPNDRLAHAVRVLAPGAPLGEQLAAAGPAPLVNSRHHQGVRCLGAGLLAVAVAPDGLIEAAILSADAGGVGGGTGEPRAGENGAGGRAADGWWVRGVEWHPENLLAQPEQMALWRDFAAAVASAASGGRAGSGSRGAEIAVVPSRHL